MPATIAFLIPFPPLAAFAVILLLTRRHRALSTIVAVGMLAVSVCGALIVAAGAWGSAGPAGNPIAQSTPWIPGAADGSGAIRIGVLVDGLTALTLCFVALTLLAIFIYSIGYHNFGAPKGEADIPGLPPRGVLVGGCGGARRVPSVEPLYSRFFAFLSLFAFGMLLLVLADNLVTLFIGWEVMGLCSYLLIGFWFARERARRAGVKAFLVTRIGDVLMMLGLALCWQFSGTLSLREILAADNLARMAAAPSGVLGLSAAGLAALLLLAGTIGKSAQWPLHVWLPDAMEGPTPVSALIHAATMVSAGVYLLLRTAPLMSAAGTPATDAASCIGAFTALLAAAVALSQTDIKRVLAWSTISQLGYMVAAAGIGAHGAAAFHLAIHAFFKALLFLGAGSVIHGVEHGAMAEGHEADAQDMRAMGGLASRMPVTFTAFLAGGLSLVGFPLLTAGFWSKDEILASALHASTAVFLVLAAAALLTAFYTARQITLVFLGRPRSPAAAHAAEPSRWMLAPIAALAVFAVGAGWAGIPENFPVLGGVIPNAVDRLLPAAQALPTESVPFSLTALRVSVLVSLAGLTLGWLTYRRYRAGEKDPLERLLGPVHGFLQSGCRFDDLYRILFVVPARWIADVVVSDWIDRRILDGALRAVWKAAGGMGRLLRNAVDLPLVNGAADRIAGGTKRAGAELRVLQSGRVQEYLLIGLIAITACGAALAWRILN
ncbi:MAG: NADH-quinone oxidoreductase subunit L [Anaerolineales bacterium]|nr:NADH-quinone oxidoreductase subunit L [Anaerolineales bacterium]